MAELYFPNPIAALPTPQFQEPQSNTGMVAMGSALQALSSVANNFRTKEMNVQKASQMADALEREGLTQEAGLYRAAAENYQTNFFATPEENERFNQSLLNDTLRLLTNKQEREMKAQQLQLERRYKEALISSQEDRSGLASDRLALATERLELQREKTQAELAAMPEERRMKEEEKKSLQIAREAETLNKVVDNNRQLLAMEQEKYEKLKQLRRESRISKEEYEARAEPILININEFEKALARLQSQSLSLSGQPSKVSYMPTEYEEVMTDEERDAQAIAALEGNMQLKTKKIGNSVYERKDTGEIVLVEGKNSLGETYGRVVKTYPIDATTPSGIQGRGPAPGLPTFNQGGGATGKSPSAGNVRF